MHHRQLPDIVIPHPRAKADANCDSVPALVREWLQLAANDLIESTVCKERCPVLLILLQVVFIESLAIVVFLVGGPGYWSIDLPDTEEANHGLRFIEP